MNRLHAHFPSPPGGLAHALADEPVLIDGMKVLFDTKVALFPVTLDPEPNGVKEAAAGPRGRDRGRA